MTGSDAGAIMNTLVFTCSLPKRKSRVATAARWRAMTSGGPNVSAWLGQTVAHIGRSPTDVRS